MDRLLQDLRFATRLLWKDRSFSLTTIATLALCLAANVAIFAVVDGVLLKPLPFAEPDRLVRMFNKYPGAGVVAEGSTTACPTTSIACATCPRSKSIAMFRAGRRHAERQRSWRRPSASRR